MKHNDSVADRSPEIRPEVGEVMDYIRHIFKALRVSSSQFEKDLGLSAAQVFVLKKLKDEPGLSINELANRTVTHQSSVSVVVKKLEEQKLVQRSTSKQDSRKVVVFLTEEGAGKLAKIPRALQEDMIETLLNMPNEKTVALAKLMKEFVQKAGIVDGSVAPMFDEYKS
ncbi:MarR family winged helix-turn-helix transcriptional regulator [Bdellovibrio svalbardensis]|uniref:MarR family winged helix-turn-helix transcriptional regulator n=1 Tax=Bdellovibrio svalbardensis TaxID=2972972 RepID=A0ABT6DR03_9BACT|nr:MarR family winged helix-turn-helix transcriptional regulator [Bdellovibrio svalbardensis]MDG0817593.1 MarR family winged helix-turn-helix transcriptional regulator [Bdellovibrio svalbardensis]